MESARQFTPQRALMTSMMRSDPARPWHVPPDRGLDQVVAYLDEQATRTHAVLTAHAAEDVAATTGRFAGQSPPYLRWICFHLLQEYARHAGHLDVARELVDGATGEDDAAG